MMPYGERLLKHMPAAPGQRSAQSCRPLRTPAVSIPCFSSRVLPHLRALTGLPVESCPEGS